MMVIATNDGDRGFSLKVHGTKIIDRKSRETWKIVLDWRGGEQLVRCLKWVEDRWEVVHRYHAECVMINGEPVLKPADKEVVAQLEKFLQAGHKLGMDLEDLLRAEGYASVRPSPYILTVKAIQWEEEIMFSLV